MRTQRARSDAVVRNSRGEVRHWKVPGLSKLRIGGDLGKAAEKLKHAKVMGIPVMAGVQAATGNVPGAVLSENARAGGDWQKTGDYLKEDLIAGAKNVPVVGGVIRSGVVGRDSVTGDPIPNADSPNAHSGDDGTDSSEPGGSDGAIPNAPASGQDWLSVLKEFGGDAVKAAAAFAKRYGSTALEIANIANAAQRQAQADKYAKGALEGTEQRFAAKQGLRDSGISGMMNPGTGADLSNLRAIANAPRDPSKLASIAGPQSGNPFAGAVPPRAIPNAPRPRAPQVYDTPNPMAPGALPIAAPPVLAPGQPPATGQRPQPPYDPRKLPLPIATRLNG